MTFPDYREILDRMASLNGSRLTAALPSHRLEITSHRLQVLVLGELLGS
jgi:hypothetical protein